MNVAKQFISRILVNVAKQFISCILVNVAKQFISCILVNVAKQFISCILVNVAKQFISCILVNARSIINKMDELESYVCALKPDLIMIFESWAREDISDAELSIDDITISRSDRKIYVGGGCILYIKNGCNATLVKDLTTVPDTKTVWYKLVLSNVSI